jgi:hypothetical protein
VQSQSSGTRRVELGGGLAVETTCSVRRGCHGWTPIGFELGDASRWLVFARVFARVPATGRLLAVPTRPTESPTPSSPPRLLRSDDAGRHWVEVAWSGSASPSLFAFDDRTLDGVAAGDAGHVWTTRDAGEHWTDHGSEPRVWAGLAMAQGEIVLLDSAGNVFRSSDGGFARESVAIEHASALEQRATEIVVHSANTDCTIMRGAPVRCGPR